MSRGRPKGSPNRHESAVSIATRCLIALIEMWLRGGMISSRPGRVFSPPDKFRRTVPMPILRGLADRAIVHAMYLIDEEIKEIIAFLRHIQEPALLF